jgi:hypothetical protein
MKSVQPGDIDTDNSDQYIKRLIQEDYIGDASVVMVLGSQRRNPASARSRAAWIG